MHAHTQLRSAHFWSKVCGAVTHTAPPTLRVTHTSLTDSGLSVLRQGRTLPRSQNNDHVSENSQQRESERSERFESGGEERGWGSDDCFVGASTHGVETHRLVNRIDAISSSPKAAPLPTRKRTSKRARCTVQDCMRSAAPIIEAHRAPPPRNLSTR